MSKQPKWDYDDGNGIKIAERGKGDYYVNFHGCEYYVIGAISEAIKEYESQKAKKSQENGLIGHNGGPPMDNTDDD